jgi:hypothetical protein
MFAAKFCASCVLIVLAAACSASDGDFDDVMYDIAKGTYNKKK